jgi:hypothetical protein
VPELGTVTGAGVVSSNNALNFDLVANLSNAASGAAGGIGKLVGVSGKNVGSLPFKVEGTTSKPVFIPNVGGMLAGGASKGLGGLLGNTTGAKKSNLPLQNPLGGLLGKKPK